jgi:hypothetical protein
MPALANAKQGGIKICTQSAFHVFFPPGERKQHQFHQRLPAAGYPSVLCKSVIYRKLTQLLIDVATYIANKTTDVSK